MFSVAVPELVSVTLIAPLVVPTSWPAKLRLPAEKVVAG